MTKKKAKKTTTKKKASSPKLQTAKAPTPSKTEAGPAEACILKNANKDIRAPIGEESSVNKMSQEERVRMAMGAQTRLDASFYERLPEYQGMQLFWENNVDGAIEKWLQLGAGLVPRRTKSLKQYKGFTDQSQSEYECVSVGSNKDGGSMMAYLLFMPAEEYHALRIAPKEARNQEIMKALGVGKSNTGDQKVMPNVTGLKTYAPNLPTGGRGIDVEQLPETHDA